MAGKPRIAICIRAFEYGGQGRVVEQELAHLREAFDLTLIAGCVRRPVPAGIRSIELSPWQPFPVANPTMVRLLQEFDLIHCHDSLGFMRAASLASRPFVVTAMGIAPIRIRHGIWSRLEGLVTLAVYPRLYRKSARVIAISSYVADWLKGFAGIEARVIRLGAAVAQADRFQRPSQRNLLYAGAIDRRKGIADLIGALKHIPGDVSLDVVGRGDITPYWRQVRSQGHAGRVRFHGVVDDSALHAMYARAFCTCSASLWEGFGLPTLEGFGFGRPAIVRSQGGLEEQIRLSGAGFAFSHVNEVGSYISRVSENWDLLSRRALDFAGTQSWQSVFRQYADVFSEVIGPLAAGRAHPYQSHGGVDTRVPVA